MARPRTTTPTKPDDARAQRSIEALCSALLTLLEHKPFDEISIREITQAAGLSYPTFFRRFGGKDELLEHIATAEVRELLRLGESAFHTPGAFDDGHPLCTYVQEHRKLWKVLLNGGAVPAMREEFMRASREIMAGRPRANPWVPLDLAVPFTTASIFEILAWWMRQPDDYPIENVTKLFYALIIQNIGRRREIDLVEIVPPPGAPAPELAEGS